MAGRFERLRDGWLFAMGSDNIMLAAGVLLVNAEIPECLEKC